ncbi:hypothetical protein Z945_2428 [Sulfitobacter noctilucae]|nr:hypothetical protein [Sulfitobacter noctilucae]KIN61436.1 hypothetical protein Z945_2428 [Sulfitobacter noctilucae]
MKPFLIAGVLLAALVGCTEPEPPAEVPEDTGPEIVPLSVPLAT